MANVSEVTRTLLEKGLSTILFFDRAIKIEDVPDVCSLTITTAIMPGSVDYPYETMALDSKGNKFYDERCSEQERVASHLRVVDEYKRLFLAESS